MLGSLAFAQLLSSDRWPEAQSKRVKLEDDKIAVWEKALEFATTGDLLPKIVANPEPCGDPVHLLPSSNNQHTTDERSCLSLDPPARVFNHDHRPVPFRCRNYQFGDWTVVDKDHELFGKFVDLYFLADKYLWRELMEAAFSRIVLFPISPAAFAILAAKWHDLCPSEKVGSCSTMPDPRLDWSESLREKFRDFVEDGFRYHVHAMDIVESWPEYLLGTRYSMARTRAYGAFNEWMENSMDPEAWALYKKFREMRKEVSETVRAEMQPGYYECGKGTRALLIECWSAERASAHLGHIFEPMDMFERLGFSEGTPGDLIVNLDVDSPAVGYVYGFNVKTQREGWFPRTLVRLLEEWEEECQGNCCAPVTFKYNGLRLSVDEDVGWLDKLGRKNWNLKESEGEEPEDEGYHDEYRGFGAEENKDEEDGDEDVYRIKEGFGDEEEYEKSEFICDGVDDNETELALTSSARFRTRWIPLQDRFYRCCAFLLCVGLVFVLRIPFTVAPS